MFVIDNCVTAKRHYKTWEEVVAELDHRGLIINEWFNAFSDRGMIHTMCTNGGLSSTYIYWE
jgi:hypothetical protein